MARVESISKFGFVADGKTYKYADVSVPRVDIVPGAEIALDGAPTKVTTEVKVDTDGAKHFTPKYQQKTEDKMSKAEWQAKDRSQLIGGLSHDAAVLAVAVCNLDGSKQPGVSTALAVYKELLEGIIKIRDEVK